MSICAFFPANWMLQPHFLVSSRFLETTQGWKLGDTSAPQIPAAQHYSSKGELQTTSQYILPGEAFPIKGSSRAQPVKAVSSSKIFPLCSWHCLLQEAMILFHQVSPNYREISEKHWKPANSQMLFRAKRIQAFLQHFWHLPTLP